MHPQFYEALTERLLAAGGLDAWLTPVQMKKGRPVVVLSVLAPAGLETVLADMLLSETMTFGVRIHEVRRLRDGIYELRAKAGRVTIASCSSSTARTSWY
jgi:uncharacterized protein (DUF111 family)